MKYCKNKDRSIPLLKTDDGRVAIAPQEKSEIFADKFSEFHHNPLANVNQQFTNEVKTTVSNFLATANSIEPYYSTPEEIANQVRTLKSSKPQSWIW